MFGSIKKVFVVAMTVFGCNIPNVNPLPNVFQWIIKSVK